VLFCAVSLSSCLALGACEPLTTPDDALDATSASSAAVDDAALTSADEMGRAASASVHETTARDREPDANVRAAAGPLDAATDAQTSDGTSPLFDVDGALRDAGPADGSAEPARSSAPEASLEPTFTADGAPLEAKNGAWTYIEFPDSVCRDGSRAGISLSLRAPSKKLLIYLEGGIYCYEETFCAFNPSQVDDLIFNSAKSAPSGGIFDRENPQNPLRDWNIVYVPYCSGDGHGGTKRERSDVPGGPSGQYFSGQLNLEKFLKRVVPTFKDASDVLLTGISAGGFGVLQSLALVQRAFPWLKVRHVNDSGPPLTKNIFAACMQDKFRSLWGLDKGALAACGASCPNPHDFLQDNSLFLARTFSDRPGGFIDSEEDEPMRMFAATGLKDCTGSFLFDDVPAASFRAEMLAYRDKLKAVPAYGTFIARGGQHTWINSDSFYTEVVGETKLVDWFAKIARGEAAGHVGL
jgi:hypothetical protein